MTKKIVSATAVLIGVGSLLAGCSTEQPSAGCITQDSASWYAFYEADPASIAPGCESSLAAGLNDKGELIGVFKYVNPKDLNDVKLVIRPNGLASRALRDSDPGINELDPVTGEPKFPQSAVGKMAATPDAEDFCTATEFKAASVNAGPRAADPTTTPPTTAEAATNITYQYDRFSVYAAPNAPGTQARGDLTYTRDACTVKYKVYAVWPRVECDPKLDTPEEIEADPSHSCGEGSGANPDFNLICHSSGFCKPDPSKPILK